MIKKIFSVLIVFIVIAAGLFAYIKIYPLLKTPVEEKEPIVFKESSEKKDYFYDYQNLNKRQKEFYDQVYQGFTSLDKQISLSHAKVSDVNDVFTAVIDDHPEIFYVSLKYKYIEKENEIVLVPQYLFSRDEIKNYQDQIEKNLKKLISDAKKEQDAFKRIQLAYDYIIDHVQYQDYENDQNIISALIDGKSVCAGYARSYQYILNQIGIETAYITGTSSQNQHGSGKRQGHAWLMIHIDDDYYYSDPTWGDVEEEGLQHHCMSYFMMSSDEMLSRYVPEHYEKTKYHRYIYFQTVGSYMETYERSIISQAVSNGIENESYVAEIKCKDDKVYQEVKKRIEKGNLVYTVLNEYQVYKNGIKYYCDDDLKVIELYYR